jgi:hypothetical protein
MPKIKHFGRNYKIQFIVGMGGGGTSHLPFIVCRPQQKTTLGHINKMLCCLKMKIIWNVIYKLQIKILSYCQIKD